MRRNPFELIQEFASDFAQLESQDTGAECVKMDLAIFDVSVILYLNFTLDKCAFRVYMTSYWILYLNFGPLNRFIINASLIR